MVHLLSTLHLATLLPCDARWLLVSNSMLQIPLVSYNHSYINLFQMRAVMQCIACALTAVCLGALQLLHSARLCGRSHNNDLPVFEIIAYP